MSERIPTENDILYLREAVRRRLSPPRAEHSVSVELECAVIARIEGADEGEIPFLRVAPQIPRSCTTIFSISRRPTLPQ